MALKCRLLHAYSYEFMNSDNRLYKNDLGPMVIVECDGKYYNYLSGDEVFLFDFQYTNLFENTIYIYDVMEYEDPSDEEFKHALQIVEFNKMKEELISQKKLVPFPRKRAI